MPVPRAADLKTEIEKAKDGNLSAEARTALDSAQKEVDLSMGFQTEIDEFETAARTAAADLKQISEDLKKVARKEDIKVPLPEKAELPLLQQKLLDAQSRLTQLQKSREQAKRHLQRLQTDPKLLAEREVKIPKERKAAEVAANEPAGNSAAEKNAAALLGKAQLAKLDAEARWIKVIRASAATLVPVLKEREKLLEAEIVAETERVRQWAAAVERRKEIERRKETAIAKDLVDRVHPEIRDHAERYLELAETRQREQGYPARIRVAENEFAVTKSRRVELEEQRKKMEELLKTPGMAEAIGQRLLDQKRAMSDTRSLGRSIASRQEELKSLRVARYVLQDEIERLKEIPARAKRILRQIGSRIPDAMSEQARLDLEKILAGQAKILAQNLDDISRLERVLSEWNAEEQRMIAERQKFLRMLDGKILWIRSTRPITWATLTDAWNAFIWLIEMDRWMEVGRVLRDDIREHAWLWVLAVLALVLCFVFRSRFRQTLRDLDERVSTHPMESAKTTLGAFALNVAISAMWPAVVAFYGWRLVTSTSSGPAAEALGHGFLALAGYAFVLEILRRICRRRGLAEVHFRGRPAQLNRLARSIRGLLLFGLPCVFLIAVFDSSRHRDYADSLGRLALIAGLLLLSYFLARVLYGGPSRSHSELPKWKRGLRFASAGLPVLFAVLAGVGFHYTALKFADRLLMTAGLAISLLILHALLLRWLFVMRGRLALQAKAVTDAIKESKENEESATESSGDDASPAEQEVETAERVEHALAHMPDAKPADPVKVDLATINKQTRRLVKVLLFIVGALALWAIWRDVLPAFSALDYPLYSRSEQVAKPVGDGSATQVVPQLVYVTPKVVIFALAIIIVAILLASNLPGVLEVSLLSRLPLDTGARDALASLVKYVIGIVGMIIGLSTLGIRWQQIQWLVAALTVGLGFGLQEIFANFVCGLILIFERPIRVGDIVTVGETTGVVTKIRIRATTVRNWDRQEFLIPNKNLITGTLKNWTLEDEINRIVINVGVAYGTDTEEAVRNINEILLDHPLVIDEPPPLITFEGFADSSLTIVVRAFLPDLSQRMATIHELHTRIHERFNEVGIEIAFPQQDLNIRSIEGTVQVAQSETK